MHNTQRTPCTGLLIFLLTVGCAASAFAATPIYQKDAHHVGDFSTGSARDWFCGFKRISGNFDGDDDKVELSRDERNRWILSIRGDVTAEALCTPTTGKKSKSYAWEQGQGPVKMGSTEGRLCALTAVHGNFQGGGEEVRVFTENGVWLLGGDSDQDGVGGKAVCVDMPGTRNTGSWDKGQAFTVLDSATNRTCFLTSMSGEFEGGGEWVGLSWLDGLWLLGGDTEQDDISTSAVCIKTN